MGATTTWQNFRTRAHSLRRCPTRNRDYPGASHGVLKSRRSVRGDDRTIPHPSVTPRPAAHSPGPVERLDIPRVLRTTTRLRLMIPSRDSRTRSWRGGEGSAASRATARSTEFRPCSPWSRFTSTRSPVALGFLTAAPYAIRRSWVRARSLASATGDPRALGLLVLVIHGLGRDSSRSKRAGVIRIPIRATPSQSR